MSINDNQNEFCGPSHYREDLQIKIITATHLSDLEKICNLFIIKNDIKIIKDIKYDKEFIKHNNGDYVMYIAFILYIKRVYS